MKKINLFLFVSYKQICFKEQYLFSMFLNEMYCICICINEKSLMSVYLGNTLYTADMIYHISAGTLTNTNISN